MHPRQERARRLHCISMTKWTHPPLTASVQGDQMNPDEWLTETLYLCNSTNPTTSSGYITLAFALHKGAGDSNIS